MVQSDPDFDVVDVKADVSQNGNVMVTSITAIHKTDQSKFTNISVLSGAECFVRDDIQIYSSEVLDVKIGETWKLSYISPMKDQLYTWDYTLHLLIQHLYQTSEVELITYKSTKHGSYSDMAPVV